MRKVDLRAKKKTFKREKVKDENAIVRNRKVDLDGPMWMCQDEKCGHTWVRKRKAKVHVLGSER